MVYYAGRAKKAAGTYVNNGRGWSLQGSVQNPEDFEIIQNADGKSLTIRKYNGLVSDVSIPAELYGLPVTAIGRDAFKDTAIGGVVIPDGVVSIARGAFSGNQLTDVDIPNSVTIIGESAFSGNRLARLALGNGLSDIGDYAFSYNRLASVIIPNSVTIIGRRAFENNQLTSVVIPNGVTLIGERAFDSNQLTSITLGSGLVALGERVFSGNPLSSITIARDVPEGRVTIGRENLRQYGISTAAGFEESFVNYYSGQNRAPGTYVKNGPIWSKR
jgi:hypothetical protein